MGFEPNTRMSFKASNFRDKIIMYRMSFVLIIYFIQFKTFYSNTKFKALAIQYKKITK